MIDITSKVPSNCLLMSVTSHGSKYTVLSFDVKNATSGKKYLGLTSTKAFTLGNYNNNARVWYVNL